MKHKIKFAALLVVCISAVNCVAQSKNRDSSREPKTCSLVSESDAEKILGRAVRLIEKTVEVKDKIRQSRCTFAALSRDKASGSEINLYFMLEETPDEERARQIFEPIRKSNEDHLGFENLSGVGDRAYAHSDKSHFHYVMAQKGKFTIRLKVNKAVETTSFDELKAFLKRAVKQI